jgi:hypothetical protein
MCGPDITLALIALEEDMKNHFRAKWNKRQRACDTLSFFDWDVDQLHNPSVKNANCPTPDCADTVEMFGRCVMSDDANYYMYGVMNALCFKEFLDKGRFGENAMVRDIYSWKAFAATANGASNLLGSNLPPRNFFPTDETLWAARLGYKKGFSGGIAIANSLKAPSSSKCLTGCGAWKGTFTWHWEPIHRPRMERKQ